MNKRDIEIRIGENLKELREGKGITQEVLSARLQVLGCDMSRSTLAKIEVGHRHIYLDEIIHLKTALGIEYDQMFDISERKQEEKEDGEDEKEDEEKQP